MKNDYKIKIIIGRKNQEFEVDLDLSGIQLDNKISRNQATVVMVSTGVFLILNNGKLPIYVDGKIVTSRCKTQLYDKSLIEVIFQLTKITRSKLFNVIFL